MNSTDEAMQDHCEQQSGVDVDLACTDCEEATVARYVNGEPVDESALTCSCGGEMRPV
jgi:hypothetical protein